MKKIIMKLGVLFLNVIYFFMKLFPTKYNRIVFISRQTDKPSIDFRMLSYELCSINGDLEIIFICKKIRKNYKEVLKNAFVLFKEMYYLSTSKICITDGYNIPISVLSHKNKLKIFQLWHSLGAIKKFGYQTLNTKRKKESALVLKMHKNYDYIITSFESQIKYFMKAFNYPRNSFYSVGLPRMDYLKNNIEVNKEKIYKKYPKFKNKKVVLYAPTFRDNNNYKINELINSFDFNKYVLIIKVHPIMDYEIKKRRNLYICDEFTTLQLLSVADYVITDYSAVIMEACILNKPIFLYTYDIDEYKKKPGLNIDLEKEFKGYLFKNSKELCESFNNNYNMKIVNNFKKKYMVLTFDNVTQKIAYFVLKKGYEDEKNYGYALKLCEKTSLFYDNSKKN